MSHNHEGLRLNDLPGIEGLEKGDLLDVTLKRSSRVRKGCRGKTYRIIFDRVGVLGVTDSAAVDEHGLEAVVRSKEHDGGWVLEGRLGSEDGILQGFHDWSISRVERVLSDPAVTIGPDEPDRQE